MDSDKMDDSRDGKGGKQENVSNSDNFSDEDNVPLSKLVPQVRAERDRESEAGEGDITGKEELKSQPKSDTDMKASDVSANNGSQGEEQGENETAHDGSKPQEEFTSSKGTTNASGNRDLNSTETREENGENPGDADEKIPVKSNDGENNRPIEQTEDECLESKTSTEVETDAITNDKGVGAVDNPGKENAYAPKDKEELTDMLSGADPSGTDKYTTEVESATGDPMDVDQAGDTATCSESMGVSKKEEEKDCDKTPPGNSKKMEIDDDSDGEDAYEAFNRAVPAFASRQKKKASLRIVISNFPMKDDPSDSNVHPTSNVSASPQKMLAPSSAPDQLTIEQTFSFNLSDAERELEDSLKFFEQPHEEQDPIFAEFEEKERKNKLQEALRKLDAEEEAGRREIEIIVSQQLKEKQISTDKSVEKYKVRTAAEEKKELARLQKNYEEKCKSNQLKIDQGMMVLRKRHSDEVKRLMQQHRLQLQHRQVSQDQANAEWKQLSERLQAKQQRLIAEFASKGDQVKQKCQLEFQRECARVHKIFEKKNQDVDANRQAIYTKIQTGFQQVRQRYLKRHSQSIAAKKKNLLQNKGNLPENIAEDQISARGNPISGVAEENEELRPPSPIKTFDDWFRDSPYEPSFAAARHKHRKAVLSQINKQLSVEIHNEGIWISQLKTEESDKNKKKDESSSQDQKQFIPWGVKARDVLASIICGEIPEGCGLEKFDFDETASINGGHIRCVMTDLRTSDETAAFQRVEAILHQKLNEASKLDSKMKELQTNVLSTEKGIEQIVATMKELELKLAENTKEVEKTKTHYQTFRNKFSRYFGPGKSRLEGSYGCHHDQCSKLPWSTSFHRNDRQMGRYCLPPIPATSRNLIRH
jgi:hypothetical protein